MHQETVAGMMRTIYGDHENSRIPISHASPICISPETEPEEMKTVFLDYGTYR